MLVEQFWIFENGRIKDWVINHTRKAPEKEVLALVVGLTWSSIGTSWTLTSTCQPRWAWRRWTNTSVRCQKTTAPLKPTPGKVVTLWTHFLVLFFQSAYGQIYTECVLRKDWTEKNEASLGVPFTSTTITWSIVTLHYKTQLFWNPHIQISKLHSM